MTTDGFIADGVRTPVGRYGGALAKVRPDDLAAVVVRALVARRPDLDPARIDDVCLAEWPELDPSIVNPAGGAIAIGHPLGCSGARPLTSLAWRLHRDGARWGLAAMCIGVGHGIAVVLEGG